MAQNNAINRFTTNFTLEPGSGDSWIQFSINGTDKFRLGVDATDDSWTLSDGNALGTTNRVNIDTNGVTTFPVQPSAVSTDSDETNVTGNGTDFGIGQATASSSVFDRNSDFTEGDGAGTAAFWTAPVTGVYHLFFAVQHTSTNVSPTVDESNVFFVTTARNYIGTNQPNSGRISGYYSINARLGTTSHAIVKMTASDTCEFHVQAAGGTKTVGCFSVRMGATLLY